jgi:hypothetical protein
VSVVANTGTLTDVQMVNDSGKQVERVMTPDDTYYRAALPDSEHESQLAAEWT